jgi:hypothetical protein
MINPKARSLAETANRGDIAEQRDVDPTRDRDLVAAHHTRPEVGACDRTRRTTSYDHIVVVRALIGHRNRFKWLCG